MKMFRKIGIVFMCVVLCFTLFGCSSDTRVLPTTPDEAIEYLAAGNAEYIQATENDGDISSSLRAETVENGQSPYAVILTCSDSRVVPEHIFMEGIGSLFTIRNAGNIVDDTTLGSIEYGAEHLGALVVVVLGHTSCGAVDATISGGSHGYITTITDKISSSIGDEVDNNAAEIMNVEAGIADIMQSETIAELVAEGSLKVVGAIYNSETGEVEFL